MAGKSFEVPEAGSDAYLSYSVQDAPSTSYAAYLHSIGKHYTWFRRNFKNGENSEGYMNWKYATEQNYKNYLAAYNANYNDYQAKRSRMEGAGFSGQYLANGLGAGFSSEGSSSASGFGQPMPGVKKAGTRGLERIMQSLELMNNAGIAMKNFGEGKAAMKYADSDYFNRVASGRAKADQETEKALLARVANANPNDYGYWRDPKSGKWVFTGQGTDMFNPSYIEHSTWMDEKIKKLNGMDLTNELRQIEAWEKTLDYQVKQKYQEATAKAQNELLEGKVQYQTIENEYVEALKAMGVAMPIIQLLVKSLL